MRARFGNHNVDVDMVRVGGQQLTFAHMHKLRFRPGIAAAPQAQQRLVWPNRPVKHEQLIMFEILPNLRGSRRVARDPRDSALAAALDAHVTHAEARHHWKRAYTDSVRGAIRILLGLQHTPGAVITATEIDVLRQVRLPVRTVSELLTEVGMFHDDRIPTMHRWFQRRVDHLPAEMRAEIGVWFDVMINGSRTTPRRRPRNPTTIELYTAWALPVLTAWSSAGKRSLREISRDDVVAAALPAPGVPRAQTTRALRSIFELLKARRAVFINPTVRLHVWADAHQPPRAADLDRVAAALDPTNPARAAVVALVSFHGLDAGQIRRLQLTDIRDRRLHVGQRVIPLADPVRIRATAYLTYRHGRWPNATNPHFFINLRTAQRLDPVGYRWLALTVDYPGGVDQLRQDRILHEAIASRGDTRRLCDMFGLSITAASRYTNASADPDLTGR